MATILIISGASAQNSVHPMIFPLWSFTIAFSMPSVCFNVRERTTEVAGKRETLKEYPLFSGKSDMSQRRVDKYGIRNRVTISDVPFLVSEKLVADDPEII